MRFTTTKAGNAPTIIPGVYGDTILAYEGGNRPEPTQEERAAALEADRVGSGELCKRFGVTSDTLQQWTETYGFPKPITAAFRGRLFPTREFIRSRRAVEAWCQEMLSIAAKLQ